MKIFHNPRCGKSRETLKLIQDAGIEPEIIEYLTNVPSEKELTEIVGLLGISPEELVRKNEEDYKTHFKGKKLSNVEWIKAMITYPKLIERPIVVKNKKAVLGRPPENVRALF